MNTFRDYFFDSVEHERNFIKLLTDYSGEMEAGSEFTPLFYITAFPPLFKCLKENENGRVPQLHEIFEINDKGHWVANHPGITKASFELSMLAFGLFGGSGERTVSPTALINLSPGYRNIAIQAIEIKIEYRDGKWPL